MQNAIATLGTISWGRRLMLATAALGLLLVLGFAQPAVAQVVNALTPAKNYFVTGDYVVGGWDFTTGNISIPDLKQPSQAGVPASVPPGADIVAAFLYWESVESTNFGAPTGMNGSFNGYPIAGTQLGNLKAPTNWSSGGCGGSSQGSKTIHAYRADVRPFLPVDPTTGRIQANGSFPVSLAGPGSNQTPFTLGASLVVIYRVQSPLVPLNLIVLYDGAVAPSNQTPSNVEMIQTIQGFYQPDGVHRAKITHIVGDGQPNKGETAQLNGTNLAFLYPAISTTAAFPGVYNGSWDNATWDVTPFVKGVVPGFDTSEQTSVITPSSGGGCVDWGAIIFSTTVANSDGDGLLDTWKLNQGYTDLLTGQAVALPGAKKGQKDLFMQIDYLSNLDGLVPSYPLHSHLPKQNALDMVGDALAAQGVHIHFNVGANYALNGVNCSTTAPFACPDPYIIPAGTGGNKVSESTVLCADGATVCQFPGQVAVGWKEGFLFFKNQPLNYPDEATCEAALNGPCIRRFQPGLKDSYRYVLFGHALGAPRSFWAAFGETVQSAAVAKLISIVDSGTTATVTMQTPPGLLKPGDCPNSLIPACTSDLNLDRVSITGAIGQLALNGTYHFTSLNSNPPDNNGIVTTTFNIATTNITATCTVAPCVANGTYTFGNESQLAVVYGGPTSSSGHSDVGGGDSTVTFGLWLTDDVFGCQVDPSVTLAPGQTYCTNQVGTITAEAGTLLHEMGHTFFLTHGGTFFPNGAIITDPKNPLAGQQTNNPLGVPSYGLNCNPAFLSSMNYLHQIRGFPDGGIGYSGQTLPSLDETKLSESLGIGSDIYTGLAAAHFTRWYARPNALDIQLGRVATRHCDGTPLRTDIVEPAMVRVSGSTFSSPIDWNNDFDPVPDPNPENPVAWQDVNFNGSTSGLPDPPAPPAFNDMQGFNDWVNLDLRQVSSRARALGFSSGGTAPVDLGGGTAPVDLGGGTAPVDLGGGTIPVDVGGGTAPVDLGGGASPVDLGGGNEQNQEAACSDADPPTGLMASNSNKTVVLNWTPPGVCQVSRKAGYTIWRAVGSFSTITPANRTQFTNIGTVNAPSTTFTDNDVKNNTTYTYFVTDTNTQGATSGASTPATVFVKF